MELAGIRGKTKAAKAAWDKAARTKGVDLDEVMAAFSDVASPDALARLALLPVDPRVDAGLVAVCEAAPYRATMTQPFWRALFKRLADTRDASLVERLASATLYAGVAPSMQAWLKKQTGALVAQLKQQPLKTTTANKRPAAAKHDLAALEAAVYADPDDDAPRSVYADALVEQGDPRGEFIHLQLRGDPAKKLAAAHGKTWLGPFAPFLRAKFAFARGFLDTCEANPDRQDAIAKHVGHPMWSTVRAFGGSAKLAFDPVMRSLRELDYSTYEARMHGMKRPWHELLVRTERPLTALTYQPNRRTYGERQDPKWGDADELVALAKCATLPQLKQLSVICDPEVLLAFAGSPVAKRLDRLRFLVARRPNVAGALVPGIRALGKVEIELGDEQPTLLSITNGKGTISITVTATSKQGWHDVIAAEAIELCNAIDVDWTVDAKPGFKGIASVRRAAERAPASRARPGTRR